MRVWVLVLAVLLAPADAFAWGAAGHHAIMDLAWARLSPAARAEFDRLLAAGPAHPLEACPLKTHDQASTWPDCVRTHDPFKGTYNDHFDDIPLFGSAAKDAYCAGGGCASEAIKRARAILADRRRPDGERLEALSFLIHFVGDLHQPLHAADNHDRGGNDVKVVFLGAPTYRDRFGAEATFNLHGVWDTPLVDLALADGGKVEVAAAMVAISADAARFDPDAWAAETHQLAVTVAYSKLPIQMTPNASPPVAVAVDQAYVDVAAPVVRAQLARAAARLAQTLNDALSPAP